MPIDDIVFEITERHAIEQYAHFKQAIRYYTDLGITLAIDDVGAGYSSLESIMEIRPRYVKIDASIIRGAASNEGKQAMIRALNGLAKGIGAETVAEGVETADDLHIVRELEVDFAQGYYFARPAADFIDKIEIDEDR
jgi:EAL domain-containing protein (putative c-di-GMP-specific phosphodiesterase class I)